MQKEERDVGETEAQVAPGALVGTGPSAARWRPHHHWGAAPETGVSWKKVNLGDYSRRCLKRNVGNYLRLVVGVDGIDRGTSLIETEPPPKATIEP